MLTARHCFFWTISSFIDEFYPNPNHPDYQRYLAKEIDRLDGIVLYCIHGTADGKASFYLIKNRLYERGLPNNFAGIRLVPFDKRFQGFGIDDFANQLMDQIKR